MLTGVAFTIASISPLISKIVTRKSYGTALGAMETIKDVGQALGPIVMGVILMFTSYKLAFIIVAIITSTSLLLNMILSSRK